VHMRLPISG